MKAKKLIGSIALTAALAMGTMPAFAAPGVTQWDATANSMANVGVAETAVSTENKLVSVTGNEPNKIGTGETQIFASVYDADINVTVPVAMAVAFGNYGVTNLLTPANYIVTNNSPEHPVYLQDVTGNESPAFELSPTTLTTTTGTANQLYINLGPDFNNAGLSTTPASPKASKPINLKDVDYQYRFNFADSKAAIGSAIGVGYLSSAVASMTITFHQGEKAAVPATA